MIYHKDIKYNGNYPQLGYYLTWIIGLPTWLTGVYLADKIQSFSNKPSVLYYFHLPYNFVFYSDVLLYCKISFFYIIPHYVAVT